MRKALAAVLLVAGALAPATGFSRAEALQVGQVGIRLLDAPTSRADDPRARLYVVDHVAPGTTIRRRVEVSNGTAERMRIQMYSAGAEVSGSEFRFLDARDGNELTGWTSVSPAELDVAAGRTAVATVTIAIPASASAGERYGVVWAELPPARPSQGDVSVVNRVGVRIYLSVGSGGEPPTDFAIDSLTAGRDESRRPVVTALVRNTGGRALDLSGNLKISEGPGGLSAGPFDVTVTTLAVGASAQVPIALDPAIPPGPWVGRLVLRSGPVEREATARITFPEGAASAAEPVPAVVSVPERAATPASPEAALAAAGLVLVLVLLWRTLAKKRRQA